MLSRSGPDRMDRLQQSSDHGAGDDELFEPERGLTTAIQSTNLGAAVTLASGYPAEGYYCINTSTNALQLVGGVTSKPANCSAAGNASIGPGDYIQVGVIFHLYASVHRNDGNGLVEPVDLSNQLDETELTMRNGLLTRYAQNDDGAAAVEFRLGGAIVPVTDLCDRLCRADDLFRRRNANRGRASRTVLLRPIQDRAVEL